MTNDIRLFSVFGILIWCNVKAFKKKFIAMQIILIYELSMKNIIQFSFFNFFLVIVYCLFSNYQAQHEMLIINKRSHLPYILLNFLS